MVPKEKQLAAYARGAYGVTFSMLVLPNASKQDGRISVHSFTPPVSPSCSYKVKVVLDVYCALIG